MTPEDGAACDGSETVGVEIDIRRLKGMMRDGWKEIGFLLCFYTTECKSKSLRT